MISVVEQNAGPSSLVQLKGAKYTCTLQVVRKKRANVLNSCNSYKKGTRNKKRVSFEKFMKLSFQWAQKLYIFGAFNWAKQQVPAFYSTTCLFSEKQKVVGFGLCQVNVNTWLAGTAAVFLYHWLKTLQLLQLYRKQYFTHFHVSPVCKDRKN